MDAEFCIERYVRSDRDRVFELMRAAYPDSAETLIRNWDWMYDANPFNREAERDRQAHHDERMAFLRATYSAQRLEEVSRKWGFSYDEPPPEREDEPYVVLMRNARRETIAMECVLPQQFLVGGKEQWVSTGCNWTVHPAYRKRRLSQPLAGRLRTDNMLILGWRNARTRRIADSWRKATSRAPKSPQPEMRMVPLVKPIEWGSLANLLTGSRLLGGAAAVAGATARLLQRTLKRPASVAGVSVVQVDSFDERVDQLWHRTSRDYPVMAVRDRRYLNWRFVARPRVRYTMLAAMRDSTMAGYLVFRVSDHIGAPCGFLIDYLIEERSALLFSLLLEQAQAHLLRDHVKAIVCSVATAPYRRMLRRRGFYPLVYGTPNYLASRLNSADPQLQVFADLPRWFVTMGDGNLEMSF